MKVSLDKVLEQKLSSLDRQIKEEIIARDSAPTPMQSGSDKTRQVAEQMIDSLHQERKSLLSLKNILKKPLVFERKASLNTLVTLNSSVGEKTYLLVPEGLGGHTINDIFLLSVKSPLAKAFLNKKESFMFGFHQTSYQILSIKTN
jgi:hypothetical protein